ncbi:MAG: hypothetical protein AB7O37_22990 [Vicinamibacteria bacterium]
MSPRTLKLLALSYAVKTVLLGAAWLAVPDLPDRARAVASRAWSSLVAAPQATR